jgi:oxygen-independent coproporphyrinogen-3 oxidase
MTLRPSSKPIGTIYLGGGTPSQLTIPQLSQLFLYINKVYGNAAEEITIEMNPDDVTVQYAEALTQLGINRVSMGAQTFDNQRLQFLHRRHQAEQVQQAVNILREAGFQNISIDLMYGFPNETIDDWKRDIDEALSLNVEHISAYCLMIEEGTVLFEQMRKDKLGIRNEETERAMYELLMDKLTEAGYEHYEISNFARSGYRSRHNSSYWHDVPYIGLGAAAHSYDLKSRSWNIADIKEYIASISQGQLPAESEVIDDVTHYNDCITTAVRTSDGLDLNTLSARFRSYCLKEAQPFIADGLLHLTNHHLALTRRGLFVSDYVMSSLIFV